jgi:ATP-binding cassette subfamily B protein
MNSYLWPTKRLGEALALVAHALMRAASPLMATQGPREEASDEAIGEWLESAASCIGMEAQPVETPYADFLRQLPTMGPALLRMPGGFLVILRGAQVLAPDGKKHHVPPAAIRSALCAEMEAPIAEQVEQLLQRAEVPSSKRAQARDAILRERLSATRIRGIWLLRLPPSVNFWVQLRQARVPRRLLALAGAHAVQYVLWILAWWLVGANVLSGRRDTGWLALWGLLLLTLVPLRVFITWLQGQVAIGAGARLKQRLFFGALRLEPDSIRHQGAGQLLGRVIESEAVEALALSGGFLALVALIELLIAIFVLGAGAGGALHSTLLLAWMAVAGAVAWQYFRRDRIWTDVRLAMTHDLVESMVGHRTRLAQLPPDRWHEGEDESLDGYLKASKAMDNSTTALLAIVPRGWLVLGLLGLAPAFVRGADSTARIAIAIGGLLLAYRAFRRLAAGAWQLAGAAVAWQRVAGLYQAATRTEVHGQLDLAPSAASQAVVDARNLVFRYSERTESVLRGCTLKMSAGQRLVLEGASGGGKSTFVSLLIGLRQPLSGTLLVGGFDRETLGAERWRKRIAAAPQFHENHVLAETFAFNLFMGRRGIPGPVELAEAEIICRELGLGDLLDHMPAGMLQMVGETGWQLSHGERSRLYIARALIQDPEVVVLDESFAALDPENLQRTVECVVRRAKSLLVIGHR